MIQLHRPGETCNFLVLFFESIHAVGPTLHLICPDWRDGLLWMFFFFSRFENFANKKLFNNSEFIFIRKIYENKPRKSRRIYDASTINCYWSPSQHISDEIFGESWRRTRKAKYFCSAPPLKNYFFFHHRTLHDFLTYKQSEFRCLSIHENTQSEGKTDKRHEKLIHDRKWMEKPSIVVVLAAQASPHWFDEGEKNIKIISIYSAFLYLHIICYHSHIHLQYIPRLRLFWGSFESYNLYEKESELALLWDVIWGIH